MSLRNETGVGMKQLIVLISMIMLGMYMFNIIVGDNENSIGTSMKDIWAKGIEIRTYTP
ncbi:MAG: hypothetical protein ACK5MV_02760 [Aminipila sp.]